jgi:pimeloyl-ACP methyl ester carboxylesterase
MQIDETLHILIGDVKQFIMIKGEDIKNPILLLLHGGTTETPHFAKFNQPLEKHFTVVYYDQRGEGKSYIKGSDSSLLTLKRYIQDVHELTQYLKKRFDKKKILLLGHSFGTLLGMKTISLYPEDYSAYIAVSQVADSIKSDNLAYDGLLEVAPSKVKNIQRVTKENLLTLDFTKRSKALINLSIKHGGIYHDSSFLGLMKKALLPILRFKPYSFTEKLRAIKQHEERILMYYQACVMQEVTSIKVPIYFLHGKYDMVINYALTRAYFEKLQAPQKEFITFENSAHFPPFEESEKFNSWMVETLS